MRYCPNVSCPGRVLEGIVHFASRGAMDIRGLGYERVRQLLDEKLIENVADLYLITSDQIVELEGFARQSADQLVAAIQASKQQPLSLLHLRPRHSPRGEDRGAAPGPPVRQAGCARQGGTGGEAGRDPGDRTGDRQVGERVLQRVAQSGAAGAARSRGRESRSSPRRPRPTARSRARPT